MRRGVTSLAGGPVAAGPRCLVRLLVSCSLPWRMQLRLCRCHIPDEGPGAHGGGAAPGCPTDMLFPAHSTAGAVSTLGSHSPSRRKMPPLGVRALSPPLQGRRWPVPHPPEGTPEPRNEAPCGSSGDVTPSRHPCRAECTVRWHGTRGRHSVSVTRQGFRATGAFGLTVQPWSPHGTPSWGQCSFLHHGGWGEGTVPGAHMHARGRVSKHTEG